MSKKMKKNYLICLIAVAIGFLLLCLLFDTGILGKKSAYFNGLVVIGMFYTIIVCSLNLLTGYMGEFSLGHAGFMSIGAYASAIVTTLIQDQTDLPAVLLYLIAIIVGGLAAGLIGVLVGIPALRLSGDYLCIVTVAVAEIVRVVLSNFGIPAITGKATFGKSFAGIAKVSDYHYVYITMVICIFIMYCYIRSRYGRALIAIREDRIAAAASGINVTKTKVLTFTISAFFAGVSGAIYAQTEGAVEKPHVAIVDFMESATNNEFEIFADCYRKHGIECEICEIRDLTFKDGRLYGKEEKPVDLIYRRAVTSDIMAHYEEVSDFIAAVKAEAVCLIGDFTTQIVHNKVLYHILHHPKTKAFLTESENAYIEAHVPYTALMDAEYLPYEKIL